MFSNLIKSLPPDQQLTYNSINPINNAVTYQVGQENIKLPACWG